MFRSGPYRHGDLPLDVDDVHARRIAMALARCRLRVDELHVEVNTRSARRLVGHHAAFFLDSMSRLMCLRSRELNVMYPSSAAMRYSSFFIAGVTPRIARMPIFLVRRTFTSCYYSRYPISCMNWMGSLFPFFLLHTGHVNCMFLSSCFPAVLPFLGLSGTI